MVNYYIYAKDFSGSTNGVKYYHENGLSTLEEFNDDVTKIENKLSIAGEPPTESKIIYLHWGHICFEVDENTTRTAYAKCEGNLSTEPESIIHWIQENCDISSRKNNIKLLYIITDGLIEHTSVDRCFKLNENMHYETVVFHAFSENLSQVDLSVAASFFKSRCMAYRNYELYDSTDISTEFDYTKVTVSNFASEKDSLKSYIKLKFMKTLKQDALALSEIDKLKKLRDRLFNELRSNSQTDKLNLNTKDKHVFLLEFVRSEWYKSLQDAHNSKIDIEKSVSALINYIVSEKKSYSFDALKFDKKFDKSVDEQLIDDIDVDFSTEQKIEFPDIILDDDTGIPVVILTECNLLDKIIFHENKSTTEVTPASFNKFRSVMECPLFLINYPAIGESIGYFYTFNVFQQFLERDTKTEPRTRKPFHGGLVLTDTDQFDQYNDYVLSMTYFNFKKIKYNVGLFYYVLWKNCESKEWMDKNVVEQFKKYAMRRISKTVCKIGLSSLPLDPDENTSLLTALWYCVELSTSIFKNDPRNFMHERLRMFHSVAHYMIEILKYFAYDLDLEAIEKRTDLIGHVMILKKIPKHREKVYYLLKRIFKTVEGFLVGEIENPFNLHKLNHLKFNHKEILRDEVVEETVHLSDFVHLMYYSGDFSKSNIGGGGFEICEKTVRPFFAVERNTSFYTELVKATKKVVINNDDDKDKIEVAYNDADSLEFDRVLSLYNLFIKCVLDNDRYPTWDEYTEYVSKKKKFRGDLVTIFPSNVYLGAKDVFARYQDLVGKIKVTEFIKNCKTYVKRTERIKAEERVKFNNDEEINAFISNEEFNVHLKKSKVK